MTALWEDIRKAVKDGYITAAGKTEELTRIGKVKLDSASLKRKIDKTVLQLGDKIFQLLSGGKSAGVGRNKEIRKLVDEIKQLKAELVENEKQIETIKEEERAKINQRKAQP